MGTPFSERSSATEWMDGPVNEALLQLNLQEIHNLNNRMRIYDRWSRILHKQQKLNSGQHIAELGCGSGMGLCELRLRLNMIPLEWIGIDWNSALLNRAKDRQKSGVNWLEGDALHVLKSLEKPVDWAIGTLFLHHINPQSLPDFLAQLRPLVRQGVIFEDLHRTPLAYYGFRILAEALGLSEMSKHDGALSVLRSFKKRELESLFLQAGWAKVVFCPSFPGRFFICAYHD